VVTDKVLESTFTMRFQVPLALAAICQLCFCTGEDQKLLGDEDNILDSVRLALKKASIIDEVIDDFKPSCYVAPYYGGNHNVVDLGNTFKPSTTKEMPSLTILCPDMNETSGLTIVLTDPDAPSRNDPKWSEMCHWIAIIPTDLQGKYALKSPMAVGDVSEVIEYKPPGPPPKTGYHRYVFLLLEGDNTNLTAPEDRQHWGTGKERHGARDWAEKEGLEIVGANFFYEKNKEQ